MNHFCKNGQKNTKNSIKTSKKPKNGIPLIRKNGWNGFQFKKVVLDGFFKLLKELHEKMFLKVFKKFELFCDLKDIQKTQFELVCDCEKMKIHAFWLFFDLNYQRCLAFTSKFSQLVRRRHLKVGTWGKRTRKGNFQFKPSKKHCST